MSETDCNGDSVHILQTSGRPAFKHWATINVVLLGLAFMLIFTAFQTCAMLEETILEVARNETNGTFNGNGYTSLAIIYGVLSVANWAAPSIISVIGAKFSMVIGSLFYGLFILSFLKPMTWALYLSSVLVGIGAAMLWTGQGNYLTLNSTSDTIGRNSGIFWALLQFSLLFGNLYVYISFKEEIKEEISGDVKTRLFIIFSVVCGAGILLLMLLRKPPPVNSAQNNLLDPSVITETTPVGPLRALKDSVNLFLTRRMILLSLPFAYTGFELTFYSGVYGTAVGHTMFFGAAGKSFIGLCGILIGCGEILGGALFGFFGKKSVIYGRDPIILLGYVLHMTCFYLIFLSFPSDSTLTTTSLPTYIQPSLYIVCACAFLLGLGDSCFNTQLYSLIGASYPNNSAAAFAIYKFVQSLAAAGGFFYSTVLLLQWQLLILVIFGTIGSLSFFIVENRLCEKNLYGYHEVDKEDGENDDRDNSQ